MIDLLVKSLQITLSVLTVGFSFMSLSAVIVAVYFEKAEDRMLARLEGRHCWATAILVFGKMAGWSFIALLLLRYLTA